MWMEMGWDLGDGLLRREGDEDLMWQYVDGYIVHKRLGRRGWVRSTAVECVHQRGRGHVASV